MSARPSWRLRGLVLAAGLSACRPSAPEPLHAPAATASAAATKPAPPPALLPDFTQPGADGWGEAAGLRYLELLRGDASPDDALPMLVMIHGLGDRPHPDWFGELPLPAPLRVILPQAPIPYVDGFAWFAYRVADAQPHALAAGIERAAEQLARALSLLRRGRPTLGPPVVAGFSQGGMLAFALAVHHPHELSYALPIAGLLPETLWPERLPEPGRRPLPMITALHGTADLVVPIDPARRLVSHLRALGYPAELHEFEGHGHSIAAPMGVAMLDALSQAVLRASRASW